MFSKDRIQNINELYNRLYVGGASDITQSSGKKNTLIILMSVLGAIVIALAVLMVILLNGRTTEVNNDKVITNVTPLPTYTPAPTQPPAPVFETVTASSTRSADYTAGYAINYYASYINDGDLTTAWSCDRDVSLNPSITFSSAKKQHITGLKMANGYFKSEQTYTRNRRITKVLVSYEGGSKEVQLSENAYREMQDIVLDAPADTAFLTIKVLDTVYGDWKDIAISEVSIY